MSFYQFWVGVKLVSSQDAQLSRRASWLDT